ncbi:MAG TPA: hypothetical protein DGD08_00675 [Gemmatimonas aurantiaca]|nr:hypothetical protein [Gemmatimonas aurantiaca]
MGMMSAAVSALILVTTRLGAQAPVPEPPAVGQRVIANGASDHTIEAAETSDSDSSSHATRNRYLLMAAGAVTAATFNQATAMPVQWKRTWYGYGARLADQAGFGVAEESLRLGLLAAMPWKGVAMECPSARRASGHGFLRRVGAAGTCGVVNTLVVRNAEGARRPNLPLIGAITGASALSLTWRPERVDAGKGQMFVLTRIGFVSGSTALKSAYTEFTAR